MLVLDLLMLAVAGVAVVVSWAGWGAVLCRGMGRVERSWALLVSVGMAVTVAVGGVLCALGVAKGPVLLGVVAAGEAAFFLNVRRVGTSMRGVWWAVATFVVCQGVLGYFSTETVGSDDLQAYEVYPKQIQQSGTLDAPLSMRRYATYGGFAFLQAELRAVAGLAGEEIAEFAGVHPNALDGGIGAVLAAGLILYLIRPKTAATRRMAALAVGIYLLTPLPRVNSHSHQMGTVLLLAMGALLRECRGVDRRSLRAGALAGLVGAAVAAMRINYLGAVGIGLVVAAACWAGGWRSVGRGGSAVGVLKRGAAMLLPLAVLLPWAYLLYKTSGTPLYPFIKPPQTTEFLYASPRVSGADRWGWVASNFLAPRCLFLVLPALLVIRLRLWRDGAAVYLGAAAAAAVTFSVFVQEQGHAFRYAAPLLKAGFWIAVALTLRRWERLSLPLRWAVVGLLVLLPGAEAIQFAPANGWAYVLVPAALVGAGLAAAVRDPGFRVRMGLGVGLGVVAGVLSMTLQVAAFMYAAGAVAGVVLLALGTAAGTGRRVLWGVAGVAGMAVMLQCARVFGVAVGISWIGMAGVAGVMWVLAGNRHGRARTAGILLGAGVAVWCVLNEGGLFFETAHPWMPGVVLGLLLALWTGINGTWAAGVSCATVLFLLTCAVGGQEALAGMPGRVFCAGAVLAVLLVRAWGARARPWAAGLVVAVAVPLVGTAARGLGAAWDAQGVARGHLVEVLRVAQEAQEQVPSGASVLVISPEPRGFDYARNRVVVADWAVESLGANPAVPLDGPREAVVAYLRRMGLTHAVVAMPGGRHQPDATTLQAALLRGVPEGEVRFRSASYVVMEFEGRGGE
jgi:hypothetical protein